MLEFGAAAPLTSVAQVIYRACASLSLVWKRFAGGLVADVVLSSASCLRSDSLEGFLASASRSV